MKTIPLTQGQEAIVDDHWYDYLMQWKWFAQWDECTQGYYAVRSEGEHPHQTKVRMHRVVARTSKGMICDHIHHNTLDNRESELRNVTKSQSNMNRSAMRNNGLGIRGVSKLKRGNKFFASLYFQGVRVLKKEFKTLEEAVKARKDAEEKYFGEFANEQELL